MSEESLSAICGRLGFDSWGEEQRGPHFSCAALLAFFGLVFSSTALAAASPDGGVLRNVYMATGEMEAGDTLGTYMYLGLYGFHLTSAGFAFSGTQGEEDERGIYRQKSGGPVDLTMSFADADCAATLSQYVHKVDTQLLCSQCSGVADASVVCLALVAAFSLPALFIIIRRGNPQKDSIHLKMCGFACEAASCALFIGAVSAYSKSCYGNLPGFKWTWQLGPGFWLFTTCAVWSAMRLGLHALTPTPVYTGPATHHIVPTNP